MSEDIWLTLRKVAAMVAENSYSPYSGCRVGAAALTDRGIVVSGTNVEKGSYGVTLCAKCGLVSEIVKNDAGKITHFTGNEIVPPCGRCRQLLLEFSSPDSLFEIGDGKIVDLEGLIPGYIIGPR